MAAVTQTQTTQQQVTSTTSTLPIASSILAGRRVVIHKANFCTTAASMVKTVALAAAVVAITAIFVRYVALSTLMLAAQIPLTLVVTIPLSYWLMNQTVKTIAAPMLTHMGANRHNHTV